MFDLAIQAGQVKIGPWMVSESLVISVSLAVVLIIVAVLLRIFFVPRLKEEPKGFQNVIELAVESLNNYSRSLLGGHSVALAPYFGAVALYILVAGLVELIGLRSPLADLNVTVSLALMTFVLINAMGIRVKGVFGRIKTLAQPNAVMLPIKMVTDCAVPVSLACRLYGNVLGGMIVMSLLIQSLTMLCERFWPFVIPEALLAVLPGILALYFNVFHIGIQAFIFVTLSMTYIKEAVE